MSCALEDPDQKRVEGALAPAGETPAEIAAIKKKIVTFESVLDERNDQDPDKGRQKYPDMDSAVDSYRENEFTTGTAISSGAPSSARPATPTRTPRAPTPSSRRRASG